MWSACTWVLATYFSLSPISWTRAKSLRYKIIWTLQGEYICFAYTYKYSQNNLFAVSNTGSISTASFETGSASRYVYVEVSLSNSWRNIIFCERLRIPETMLTALSTHAFSPGLPTYVRPVDDSAKAKVQVLVRLWQLQSVCLAPASVECFRISSRLNPFCSAYYTVDLII